MTIITSRVTQPQTLKNLYKDFSTAEHTKYQVDLAKEAPALQRKIESLKPEERQRYEATFVSTWNSLSPTTRKAMLGGAAGGALGAGVAVTTASIKEIGNLLGAPAGFVLGVTALGVAIGALAPAALEHFGQSNVKFSFKTPDAWNVVLPQLALEFEGATKGKPKAKQA